MERTYYGVQVWRLELALLASQRELGLSLPSLFATWWACWGLWPRSICLGGGQWPGLLNGALT